MLRGIRKSKSRLIADALGEELSSGNHRPGMAVASATEIARRFSISIPTAHNVLNLLAHDGILYRVHGSGSFLTESASKLPLRIGVGDSSYALSLNKDMLANWNLYIKYALDILSRSNCTPLTFSYQELINPQFASRIADNFDALLISCNYLDSRSISILSDSGLPVVVYRGFSEYNAPFSQVCYDLNSGYTEVFRSLDNPSEKTVLVYADTPNAALIRRLYLKYLKLRPNFGQNQLQEFEIPYHQRDISCYRLIRAKGKHFRNHVILVSGDDLAVAIISAFLDEDMFPGRDYKLISIDNSEGYSYVFPDSTTPVIASIDLPKKLMMTEACRMLLSMIRHPSQCHMYIRIPTKFIPRASSGAGEFQRSENFVSQKNTFNTV